MSNNDSDNPELTQDRKEFFVYKIYDKCSGKYIGSYSRSCHNEFEFTSKEEARNANVHGIYQDRNGFDIHKIRVTQEIIK